MLNPRSSLAHEPPSERAENPRPPARVFTPTAGDRAPPGASSSASQFEHDVKFSGRNVESFPLKVKSPLTSDTARMNFLHRFEEKKREPSQACDEENRRRNSP